MIFNSIEQDRESICLEIIKITTAQQNVHVDYDGVGIDDLSKTPTPHRSLLRTTRYNNNNNNNNNNNSINHCYKVVWAGRYYLSGGYLFFLQLSFIPGIAF